MEGVKRFFYVSLGIAGFMMAGITIFIILLQCKIEINITLTIFCAISWLLFIIAAIQILEFEAERRDLSYKIKVLDELENDEIAKEKKTLIMPVSPK